MKNMITVFLLFMSFNVMAADAPGNSGGDDSAEQGPKRGFIQTHDAFETQSLRLSLNKKLSGFAEGKICDDCETIRVTITPETKAYANNVEVPLKNAKNRIGRYATVIYALDTKKVSAIRW